MVDPNISFSNAPTWKSTLVILCGNSHWRKVSDLSLPKVEVTSGALGNGGNCAIKSNRSDSLYAITVNNLDIHIQFSIASP